MDELQTPISLSNPFNLSDDGYWNSFLPSLKGSLFLQSETESFDTVIMPIMVTEAANVEQQLASMKATLDDLSRESVEKHAQIKL